MNLLLRGQDIMNLLLRKSLPVNRQKPLTTTSVVGLPTAVGHESQHFV